MTDHHADDDYVDHDDANHSQATSCDGTEPRSGPLTRRGVLRASVVGGLVASSGCLEASQSIAGDTHDDGSVEERALEVGLSARPSILNVGGGTGWVVDDGLAVTCSHVVTDEVVTVETFDGQRQEETVLERHEDVDIAILEIQTDGLEPLDRETGTETDDLPVVKVGHPDAVGTWIASLGQVVRTAGDELVADVPCGPGDSGSPLLSLDGTVVGHVTGSTTLVEERTRLDRPERLVQDYEGQRHVSQAHTVQLVEQFI